MTGRPAGRRAALSVLLAAVCALAPSDAQAQQAASVFQAASVSANGLNVETPLDRPTSRLSGLRLSIDSRWVDNYGYLPVAVTVNSPTPSTTERLITIRLHAVWRTRWWSETVVEQEFVLPSGSTSAGTVVACPKYQAAAQFYWWDVWVDGVKDRDLSVDLSTAAPAMSSAPPSSGCMMLVLGNASQDRQILNPGTVDVTVMALPLADLPTRWIDYTCLDIVSLSADELQRVADANPDALAALRRWVWTGGQLWVGNAGTQWQKLPTVDEVMGLAPPSVVQTPATTSAEAAEAPPDGWQPVSLVQRRRRRRPQSFMQLSTGTVRHVRDPETITRLLNDPDYTIVDERPDRPGSDGRRAADRPLDSSRWFVQRSLGLGYVRAFPKTWDSPGPATGGDSAAPAPSDVEAPPDSQVPQSVALQTAWSWGARHGLLPDEANRDFSNLLVPGVGLAPVTEFRVLITLFVLVIGPLNYWVLKQSQRVHLMVITVPAAAAVVTLALFTYALLSDGLGTSVRVRSFTTLDQGTGEAVCWARLSYYAGLAPRQGLDLSRDTVVYPIVPGWNENAEGSTMARRREMEWGSRDERLTVGWLNSRTPAQYLAIRSRQSPYRLELTPSGRALKATNKLGTDVVWLVAVDDAGNLFAGEHVAADSTVRLPPTSRADALARWRRFVVDNDPVSPPQLSDSALDIVRMQQRSRRRMLQQMYGRLDYSYQRLRNNLLNEAISSLAGLDGREGLPLPPRSYLAVTQTGPEVELGVPGATEEASFHVLLGRW